MLRAVWCERRIQMTCDTKISGQDRAPILRLLKLARRGCRGTGPCEPDIGVAANGVHLADLPATGLVIGRQLFVLLRQSFGSSYERLQAVKAKYDPENLFRSTFNIAPARET